MKNTVKALLGSFLVAVSLMLSLSQISLADTLKSSSYQFQETSLGGNSMLGAQSTNFQATSSIGVLGLGNSSSANLQVNAGHLTTADPTLTFKVTNFNVNFGNFSATQATVTTSTFSVINYTSYGYVVQIVGTPPTNGSHSIALMGQNPGGPEVSQAGKEQFGINLVANISPVSVGQNPDNGQLNPDGSQFGYGEAAPGYNDPNHYRYVSGETIAKAPKSSGQTDYTISYLVNVNSLTPGGQYTSHQTLICTGTY